MYKASTYHVSLHLWDKPLDVAKLVDRLTANLVDRLTAKLANRSAAKLVVVTSNQIQLQRSSPSLMTLLIKL